MATNQATERSTRVTQVHETINHLGVNCTYNQAKRHVQTQYGWELQEHNFYPVRTAIREQQQHHPQDTNMATTTNRTGNNGPLTAPEGVRTEERAPAEPAPITQEDTGGIIALVKAGKLLVEKMGKEKARELIDTL